MSKRARSQSSSSLLPTRRFNFEAPCQQEYRTDYSAPVVFARWSPDGSAALVAAADRSLHVYALPESALRPAPQLSAPEEWRPSLSLAQAGDICRDAVWYPSMSRTSPASCCFATCSKHQPIHLKDSNSGETRASYTSYDNVDAPETFLSIAWSRSGTRLYGGGDGRISVWDVQCPGRNIARWSLKHSRTADSNSLRPFAGVASCLSPRPDDSVLAVGSYGGNVGLFDGEGRLVDLIYKAQPSGVTQIMWADDVRLFVGGRKSSHICVYDVRQLKEPVNRLARSVDSHQHVFFDLGPQGHLWTGDTDEPLGLCSVYNATTGEREADLPLHNNVISSVQVHPLLPLLLTGTGQRQHGHGEGIAKEEGENCVSIWRVASSLEFK